jgi:hypothetical protein
MPKEQTAIASQTCPPTSVSLPAVCTGALNLAAKKPARQTAGQAAPGLWQ